MKNGKKGENMRCVGKIWRRDGNMNEGDEESGIRKRVGRIGLDNDEIDWRREKISKEVEKWGERIVEGGGGGGDNCKI